MNALDLKATADAVNARKHAIREASFEVVLESCEQAAKGGDYNTSLCFNDRAQNMSVVDWISKDTKQKLLERGFWFGGKSDHYYDASWSRPAIFWSEKPWWRFW